MTHPVFTFDEETHIYRLNGVVLPSITQSLCAAGLIDTEFYTDTGRWRGTQVHTATQLDDEEELDEESLEEVYGFALGELLSYLSGWRQFRKDYEFVPTLIEEPMYSATHLYAGRIDRAGEITLNGRRKAAVPEIKTGASVGATAEQTAAQVNLLENPPSWSRFEVRLFRNGKYKLTEFPARTLGRDFASFLACVTVCTRQIELFGKMRDQIHNGEHNNV
jgi:hypothetical protein